MTKRLLLAFALLMSALMGCEQTVNNVQLPYEEKLVVQSMIDTQDSCIIVFVGRTIPPVRDTKMTYWIESAEVFITIDGEKHKMQCNSHNADSTLPVILPFYFIKHKPQENETYSLQVKWKNHTATASTTVPSFEGDKIAYRCDTLKQTTEMTHIKMLVDYSPKSLSYVKFLSIVKFRDYHYSSNRELFILSADKHKDFSNELYVPNEVTNYYYYSMLAKYDPQYFEYYDSKDNGSLSEDPFSTGGLNRKGNIKGGLGYFYSRTSKNFKYN